METLLLSLQIIRSDPIWYDMMRRDLTTLGTISLFSRPRLLVLTSPTTLKTFTSDLSRKSYEYHKLNRASWRSRWMLWNCWSSDVTKLEVCQVVNSTSSSHHGWSLQTANIYPLGYCILHTMANLNQSLSLANIYLSTYQLESRISKFQYWSPPGKRVYGDSLCLGISSYHGLVSSYLVLVVSTQWDFVLSLGPRRTIPPHPVPINPISFVKH